MNEEPPIPPTAPLSKPAQWAIVVVLGLVTLFAVGADLVISGLTSSTSAATEGAKPSGAFHPTAGQWKTLKTAIVADHVFRSEIVTDGDIAIDDDLTTPVFAPYSGRVTKLFAKAGDYVTQGQSLFAVDASEFVQGQNDLTVAESNLRAARTQLDVAQLNEKRQHALYDAKAGAFKDWQQSQADRATADASYRAADIALAAVQNRLRILGKSDKEIAALENTGKMKAETIVTAPIAGTVTQRQIGIGQYIQAGASAPQFTIGDMSKVWLVANVREADAPRIQIGQAAEVKVLAFPERIFDAKITFLGPSVDPNTHRVPVRAEVANPGAMLKPAMFASFTIISGEGAPTPGVPAEAVLYEGEAARLWVALDDGAIELRQIHTGRANASLIEVTSGIRSGDKIVTSGALFIDRAATVD